MLGIVLRWCKEKKDLIVLWMHSLFKTIRIKLLFFKLLTLIFNWMMILLCKLIAWNFIRKLVQIESIYNCQVLVISKEVKVANNNLLIIQDKLIQFWIQIITTMQTRTKIFKALLHSSKVISICFVLIISLFASSNSTIKGLASPSKLHWLLSFKIQIKIS